MTTERLVTEYTADTRNFRRGARVYDQTLARQERLTNDRLSRIDRRWERSTRSILNTRTALVGLTGYVGGAALSQLRNYAEQWRDVERRLKSIGEFSKEGRESLVDLAIRTRSAVGGTASIVQRFQKSTGDGLEITMRRVETLQKLLASNGATGSERNALGIQLGQALQSGVLSGDEFRTIRENSPIEFLDALAAAAGVTRAELKGIAEDQKLTTAVVLQALDGLASTADQKFGALAVSGEEAFNILTNGLVVYAGQIDESLGATASLNGAMVSLGEYMSGAGEGAQAHMGIEVYTVARKSNQTPDFVEFQLQSALDMEDVFLPRRQVLNYCQWAYRRALSDGTFDYTRATCPYVGSSYFDSNGDVVADPKLDRCGRRLADCKLRFGETAKLPYGGFPGAGKLRTG